MKQKTSWLLYILFALSISIPAFSQTITRKVLLQRAAVQQAEEEKRLYSKLLTLSREKGWSMIIKGKNGRNLILSGVDQLGYPIYITTYDNVTSAATIQTNTLWPGGSTGLNLSGSSVNMKDKLAIWDEGRIRNTHVEFAGRVAQRDAPSNTSDHSTHVAGTMIAAGINSLAKGMSFGNQELVAYDYNNDNSEMLNEASAILVSNHSYGEAAGWLYNENESRWEFYGLPGSTEDYKFGYYSAKSQMRDSIAYNAPSYLIVVATGNQRTENGPNVGENYWRLNSNGIMVNAGNRPNGISDNDSYNTLPPSATSKNVLSVGAVYPVTTANVTPADIVMAEFSGWGPTDDGRIKPDVVTDGINVLSPISTSDNAYAAYSGTSMSAPAASGSVFLLQEYYSQLHSGAFMRSATLRGLIIHTAEEAGSNPGPDYQFGWGLINMKKAAAVITSNNTDHLIEENNLNNGGMFTQNIVASGKGPLVVTICWTDPKGDVEPVSSALNNPTKKLVSDLDVVVKRGATTYQPWVLDPLNPSAAATTGDNITDNVEKIVINDVIPGETYTIQVTHKGSLVRGSQAYSLIVSGVINQPYCSSIATANTGARIDSVSFTTIQKKNVTGCTTYSNFTNFTADIESNQTTPLYVKLNSCDATSVDKIVKAYIDYNNDGDFDDAGENIAQSGVINGDGVFTTDITTPTGLIKDYYFILRIVVEETSIAANVNACGTYTKGETQDYRVHVAAPNSDVGVTELISPINHDCSSISEYLVVRLHNYGSSTKTNVPLTAAIKQGSTTVATINDVFPGNILASQDAIYTLQTPFMLNPGSSYTITIGTALPGDQNTTNDETTASITTSSNNLSAAGDAEICGTTNVFLRANATGNDLFTWYSTASGITPIAAGSNTSSTVITGNNTYYLGKNDMSQTLGPDNKMVFADGGYNAFSGNIVKFTVTTPTFLQTARLYIGTPGKITFSLRYVIDIDPDGSYSYYAISTTPLNVYATAPTPPTLGAQVNDPNDAGSVYYLGIYFPVAGDYFLVIECEDGASIYRNNNIPDNPYPYNIPGVISITGNNATSATDPLLYQKYYYFFYNAALRLEICPSDRTPVVATSSVAPVISQNGNILSSSFTSGNQWYLNGIPIPGALAKDYTATSSGVYKTIRIDSYGCSLSSNEINFSVTTLPDLDGSEIALIVSPNPTTGQFHLELETRTKDNLSISLINSIGQKVYDKDIPGFIGRLSTQVNPGNLPSGIYYLKIEHHNKTYLKKLIISP